jgi:hypothetical protein
MPYMFILGLEIERTGLEEGCLHLPEKALRIGYDKYLSAEEILRLIPIK